MFAGLSAAKNGTHRHFLPDRALQDDGNGNDVLVPLATGVEGAVAPACTR